ncbi:MAG: nucleotidyl transferase AbiEii/AbiGii toxin family protein [Erysipelotrichaceae bacterium]|nr:nucleotidyl transferase AbiEii/AbiGii toxin family protein [Erysipelotrichaceae bacterium]
MSYLHENQKLFKEVLASASNDLGLNQDIIEKDYYVTLILKELAIRCPDCVFKGGTSLSKCHRVIERFSEDIDIAFINELSQGKRKQLKNEIILGISEYLRLPIADWENARSRRDYNCYTFSYKPVNEYLSDKRLIQGVRMETVLSSIAFPVSEMPVDSYIYRYLIKDNKEIIEEYDLYPFEMNVQGIDRTFIDKVFAVCDYYLLGKTKRYSRHLYDIHMIYPLIEINDEFKELIKEVRSIRANMSSCPSADSGISISRLLKDITEKEYFRKDYEDITSCFLNRPLSYETVMGTIKEIAERKILG